MDDAYDQRDGEYGQDEEVEQRIITGVVGKILRGSVSHGEGSFSELDHHRMFGNYLTGEDARLSTNAVVRLRESCGSPGVESVPSSSSARDHGAETELSPAAPGKPFALR